MAEIVDKIHTLDLVLFITPLLSVLAITLCLMNLIILTVTILRF